MALVGGTIRIVPTWGGQPSNIDISWDPNDLSAAAPEGDYWGDIAYLGATGSNAGRWEFRSAIPEIILYVHVPGYTGYRRLIAVIDGCVLPLSRGRSGSGRVMYGVTGASVASGPLIFDWQVP